MARLLPLAALALLSACGNPCQQMCTEMANYAQECGYEVSADELQSCREANATVDDTRAQQCIMASDADQLREWWTCEDVLENYSNGAP